MHSCFKMYACLKKKMLMDAQMYACVVDYLTSFSGIVIFLSIL